MKRPTQQDVARLAKVSRATVSMVLRGCEDGKIQISDETRHRVFEVARQIGYTPNLAAQMLAGGQNHLIGVFTYEKFFPYEADDFYYPFLLGIEREASRQGYDLLLFTRTHGSRRPTAYRNGAGGLGFVAGTVMLGRAPDPEELKRIIDDGHYFVYIGRREVKGYDIDWVSSDYFHGSEEATSYLLKLGHRRLGYCGGFSRPGEASDDRLAGCSRAVKMYRDHAELHLVPEKFKDSAGVLVDYIKRHDITAVLCDTLPDFDAVARILRERAFSIPEDISLVLLGSIGNIAPSTIDNPTRLNIQREEVGEKAVRTLISRMTGVAEGPQHVYVPCLFKIGDTTHLPRPSATFSGF